MPRQTRSLMDRFWDKVLINDGCWRWMAAIGDHGYGVIGLYGSRVILAHRLSLVLSGINVPNDRLVLHTCDNRWCVNPAHLYVGTYSQNLRDAWDRGNPDRRNVPIRNRSIPGFEERRIAAMKRGADHHRATAKLTEHQVLEIRGCGETAKIIANRFGVSHGTINDIRRRATWRHI